MQCRRLRSSLQAVLTRIRFFHSLFDRHDPFLRVDVVFLDVGVEARDFERANHNVYSCVNSARSVTLMNLSTQVRRLLEYMHGSSALNLGPSFEGYTLWLFGHTRDQQALPSIWIPTHLNSSPYFVVSYFPDVSSAVPCISRIQPSSFQGRHRTNVLKSTVHPYPSVRTLR